MYPTSLPLLLLIIINQIHSTGEGGGRGGTSGNFILRVWQLSFKFPIFSTIKIAIYIPYRLLMKARKINQMERRKHFWQNKSNEGIYRLLLMYWLMHEPPASSASIALVWNKCTRIFRWSYLIMNNSLSLKLWLRHEKQALEVSHEKYKKKLSTSNSQIKQLHTWRFSLLWGHME